MWQRLEVTRPAREMGQFLLYGPALRTKTLACWSRLMTAGLPPEPLRAPFGLRFGDRQRLAEKPGRDTLGKMIERYVFEVAIKGHSAR